jgi:hypothetical protein
VVVSLEEEDFLGDVGVPNKYIVIRSSRQDKLVILVPVEREHTLRMALKRSFRLHGVHSPETDLTIETCRSQEVHARNREQVHDLSIFVIPVIGISRRVMCLTSTNGLGVLHHVVAMNLPVTSACVQSIDPLATPFKC